MVGSFTKEISFGPWDVGMELDGGSNYRTIQPSGGGATSFTTLSSNGTSFSPSRTVLSSLGVSYIVSGNVLGSTGTSYAVI